MYFLNPIQYLLVIIFVGLIIKTINRWRLADIFVLELLVWLSFWFGAMVLVIWPQITSWFARLLVLQRGVDLVLYLSVIILFAAYFRIFVRFRQLETKIIKLIRQKSIETTKLTQKNQLAAKSQPKHRN